MSLHNKPALTALEKDTDITPEEVSEARIDELKAEVENCTPEEMAKCVQIIEAATKRATGEARTMLSELGIKLQTPVKSPEKLGKSPGFTELQEEFKGYMGTTFLMGKFQENVSEDPLIKNFSEKEKNNLQLILWKDFLEVAMGQGEEIAEIIQEKGILAAWNIPEKQMKALKTIFTEKFETYRNHIQEIARIKKEHPLLELTTPVIASIVDDTFDAEILSPKTPNEIYETVQNYTQTTAKTINDIELSLDGFFKSGIGKDIAESVKNSIKEGGIFAIILSLFAKFIPGLSDFLDAGLSDKEKKRKDSLSQLTQLSEKSNSPLAGVFSADFIDGIDVKNLDSFFSYLEGEKIDYTADNFWESLVSGKTGNKNLSLLVEEYGAGVFDKDDTKDTGKGFRQKLNSLEELALKEKTQEQELALQEQAAALPPIVVATSQNVVPKETPLASTKTPTDASVLKEVHPEMIDTSPAQKQKTTVLKQADIVKSNNVAPEKPSPIKEEEVVKKPSSSATTTNNEKVKEVKVAESSEEIQHLYETHRDNSIKAAINKHFSLPIKIDYAGKEKELGHLGIQTPKTIDFKDGKLVIDNVDYTVKFDTLMHKTKFMVTISINDLRISGVSKLTGNDIFLQVTTEEYNKTEEKPLAKSEFIKIVLGLISEGKYTSKIAADETTPEIGYQVS